MRGDPGEGTERAGNPGDAGRHRVAAPEGGKGNRHGWFQDGADCAGRGEWREWIDPWRGPRRVARRYPAQPASGEFAGPRRRAPGEIFGDAAALSRGRGRQGDGNGEAIEQGPDWSGAGGVVIGQALPAGDGQGGRGAVGVDRPDEVRLCAAG